MVKWNILTIFSKKIKKYQLIKYFFNEMVYQTINQSIDNLNNNVVI